MAIILCKRVKKKNRIYSLIIVLGVLAFLTSVRIRAVASRSTTYQVIRVAATDMPAGWYSFLGVPVEFVRQDADGSYRSTLDDVGFLEQYDVVLGRFDRLSDESITALRYWVENRSGILVSFMPFGERYLNGIYRGTGDESTLYGALSGWSVFQAGEGWYVKDVQGKMWLNMTNVHMDGVPRLWLRQGTALAWWYNATDHTQFSPVVCYRNATNSDGMGIYCDWHANYLVWVGKAWRPYEGILRLIEDFVRKRLEAQGHLFVHLHLFPNAYKAGTAVTCDNGYVWKDLIEFLKQYGIPYTQYHSIVDNLNYYGRLQWVIDAVESGLLEIVDHGATHSDPRFMSYEEIDREVKTMYDAIVQNTTQEACWGFKSPFYADNATVVDYLAGKGWFRYYSAETWTGWAGIKYWKDSSMLLTCYTFIGDPKRPEAYQVEINLTVLSHFLEKHINITGFMEWYTHSYPDFFPSFDVLEAFIKRYQGEVWFTTMHDFIDRREKIQQTRLVIVNQRAGKLTLKVVSPFVVEGLTVGIDLPAGFHISNRDDNFNFLMEGGGKGYIVLPKFSGEYTLNLALGKTNYTNPHIVSATHPVINASFTADRLTITIDAPNGATSFLRINTVKRTPKVVSGATSWDYDNKRYLLTIRVEHKSVVTVVIEFKDTVIFPARLIWVMLTVLVLVGFIILFYIRKNRKLQRLS